MRFRKKIAPCEVVLRFPFWIDYFSIVFFNFSRKRGFPHNQQLIMHQSLDTRASAPKRQLFPPKQTVCASKLAAQWMVVALINSFSPQLKLEERLITCLMHQTLQLSESVGAIRVTHRQKMKMQRATTKKKTDSARNPLNCGQFAY